MKPLVRRESLCESGANLQRSYLQGGMFEGRYELGEPIVTGRMTEMEPIIWTESGPS